MDHVAGRVRRFGHDGRLHWSFGRIGAGPNEFADLRDLKVDAEGRAWVLDPVNSRVLVLDEDGTPVRRIPLTTLGNSPRELVLLDGSGILLLTDSPDREPLVEIDTLGHHRRQLGFPWAGFKKLDYLATQLVTGANAQTGDWVMAFRLGDGFFAANGDVETRRGWFVEHVAFPEVQREQRGSKTSVWRHRHRPTDAAVSVTVSPSRIYVLFGGTSRERYRLVDSYALETGEYLNSYVLPRAVSEISWYNGGFYVLSENPYPEIRYFHPLKSSAP
ncbi:MAG TPA: hypothetical protein VE871_14135 [Longimicrobium sp.]|nr:hypothetical protein [Longimicrobium sp.]